MPSNNTGAEVRRMFEAFPGRIAHLMNPDGMREGFAPKSLDNGAFGAWVNGREWDEGPFYKSIEKGGFLWILVPDVVADREGTLARWKEHSPRIPGPLAFAVQDGMNPDDVPPGAEVIFVGGTTSWKWRNLRMWTGAFPRVHVGRVNTERLLWMAHEAGAESCDGTGWFRGDRKQLAGLHRYLKESESDGRPQMELSLDVKIPSGR